MADAPREQVRPGGLDCHDAMAVLWDFLDGELTEERVAAVRAHLDACRPCLEHHDFEKAFLQALATAHRTDVAPAALRRHVEATLRNQSLLR